MAVPAQNHQTNTGKIPSAAYLKTPPPLPRKMRVKNASNTLKALLLNFLSALSDEIDITPFLKKGSVLAETVNQAMTAWFNQHYSPTLLTYLEPRVDLYYTQYEYDDREIQQHGLKITVGNTNINWTDFQLNKEAEACEKTGKGNGALVLKELGELTQWYEFWTPQDILQFVYEYLWMGFDNVEDYARELGFSEEEKEDLLMCSKKLDEYRKWTGIKIPKNIRPIQPVKDFIKTCKIIRKNRLTGIPYATNFPEVIAWEDPNDTIAEILQEFEENECQGDYYNFHAGGLLWEGVSVRDFKTILSEIKEYLKLKEQLVTAILKFKGDMEKWKPKTE